VVRSTVNTAGRRGRATARNSLSVATSRAGRVGTSVQGAGVVQGVYGADGAGRGASGGDMTVSPAVLTPRVPGGRVGALDSPRAREEPDRGAHREHVPWVDGDDDGGGGLALPRSCVGVEISGGEDTNVLGVEDRLREARKEFFRVLREEGKQDGVDGELSFVGGEVEGQPGRISHRERLVQLGGRRGHRNKAQMRRREWQGRR